MNNIFSDPRGHAEFGCLAAMSFGGCSIAFGGKTQENWRTRAVSFPGKVVRGINQFNFGISGSGRVPIRFYDSRLCFYLVQKK